MTVREKIEEMLYERDPVDFNVCRFYKEYIYPMFDMDTYDDSLCEEKQCDVCRLMLNISLDKEVIEPEIDWSKVPVDTKLLVREHGSQVWFNRYFARYGDGKVYVFREGKTSWSDNGLNCEETWDFAKLAEEKDQ